MHLPDNIFILLQDTTNTSANCNAGGDILKGVVAIAPLLSFLVSLANIYLVVYVFRFTKRKNDTDRNIKWFQELVYTPNKENITSYFAGLHQLKDRITKKPDLSEEDKIDLMEIIKEGRNQFMISFVDLVQPISKEVHVEIAGAVDNLTDELTKALDNDELKWSNPKTLQREFTSKINAYRNSILAALFNYKG